MSKEAADPPSGGTTEQFLFISSLFDDFSPQQMLPADKKAI